MSTHPGSIDITGIDRAELLAALHNGTRSLGMGVLHDNGDMTVDQARTLLLDDYKGKFEFDYVRGRPIKVFVSRTEPDVLCRTDLYDRDAGEGKCKQIVDALRAAAK